MIAAYCEKCTPELFIPKPIHVKELEELNKCQDALTKDMVSWNNRLEKEYANPKAKKLILDHIQHLKEISRSIDQEIDEIINSNEHLKKKY